MSEKIKFILIGYVVAFTVEFLSAASGDSQIFASPVWPLFFIVWYGLIYYLAFRFQKNWKMYQILLFWAIAGPVVELVLFRGSFLVTDIFYSAMVGLPFYIHRKYLKIR